MAVSGPAMESVSPCSNQQIAPALAPPSTTPCCHAVRRYASSPQSRQTASMLRVLPPPTNMPSCSRMNDSRLRGVRANSVKWLGRHSNCPNPA